MRAFVDPFHNLHIIGYRELFGALVKKGVFQQGVALEERFHRIAQHFASLGKSLFDHFSKQGFRFGYQGLSAAHQADNARLHLRWRRKIASVDRKKVFTFIKSLYQHAGNAVNLATWGCDHAFGHFFLEHTYQFGDNCPVIEQLKQNLARDVIWEIADNCKRFPLEAGIEVELQEVGRNYIQSGIVLLQVSHHIAIGLYSQQVIGQFLQVLSQHTFARAYFKHMLVLVGAGEAAGDALRHLFVDEEMLAV